jgi:hypothetical protein
LLKFQSLQERVQKRFEDGKPPHVVGNNSSILTILTDQNWSGMSSAHVQEKLKMGPVFIKNGGPSSMDFGGELLADMLGHGNMQYVVRMEGEIIFFTN